MAVSFSSNNYRQDKKYTDDINQHVDSYYFTLVRQTGYSLLVFLVPSSLPSLLFRDTPAVTEVHYYRYYYYYYYYW